MGQCCDSIKKEFTSRKNTLFKINNTKKMIVVIHIQKDILVVEQVNIAYDKGQDGVFLSITEP